MCGFTDETNDALKIRDGLTTETIDYDPPEYAVRNDQNELVYGMHEGFDYYIACRTREKNGGLYIADRQLNGDGAFVTRQENNDNQHGYECPEDKDYYPYWAWTPWKDIAVLTDHMEYCDFYKSESQNVKSRFECQNADDSPAAPISEFTCLNGDDAAGRKWVERPAWGISEPDCVLAPWSRDNHLGNSNDGWAATYNWTLPDVGTESCIADDNCDCVLRIRYNISTGDTGDGSQSPVENFIDSNSNGDLSPIHNNQLSDQDNQTFRLAMNTAQFGRTFQDRSYVFQIRPRPSSVPPKARIFNLNVRGKRGNIVQVYPAVEYDFVPDNLEIFVGDYVHFQWTGCDTNPANNAGEGTDKTDRSNMVQIEDLSLGVPATDDWMKDHDKLFEDETLRKRMAWLDQTNCKSYEEVKNNDDDVQNCFLLNAAPRYFDGGLVRMNISNTFHYMSTRNNNFSNRGQKGTIIVTRVLSNALIGVIGAGSALFAISGGVGVAMLYAKSHPHSGVAQVFAKM